MKEKVVTVILMIIMVPLAGELKFYPFHSTFRVSLGIPVFLLFLLWARNISPISSGFIAGVSVVVFRILLELLENGHLYLFHGIMINFPAFFYYITYSLVFQLVKVNRYHERPLIIGLLAILIEITSGIVELLVRHSVLGNVFTLSTLNEVIIIAVIRSFFTLSFFSIIKFNHARVIAEQQQIRNNQMILLISSLYEESVLLKKSIQNAEDITRDCYYLYQGIQNNTQALDETDTAKKILDIAGRVHEIKKDNQRINAGLARMISSENSTDYLPVDEIGSIIVQTNERYAVSLGKKIQFILNITEVLPNLHVYTVLSLINNLAANSVESVENDGIIKISISKSDEYIEFTVADNGAGIPEKKRELIFKPGYTTKYNKSGSPSTGMGLPYVKELVTNLGGSVIVNSGFNEAETVFTIQLPVGSLIEKGW